MRQWLEPERDRGIADRLRDVLQAGGGVANNWKKSVKKKRRDGGAHTDSKKRQWNEESKQGERWNCLHDAGEAENGVTNRAAPTGENPERNTDDDR